VGREGPLELLIGMPVVGSTDLAGRGGGTARAALRGGRPEEHCGTWGTAGAAQQSFSGVGKNAHFGAKLQGALAQRDVHFRRHGLPKEKLTESIKFKILI
jgi:hypothetical protein